jgi:hypothetical protein
MTTFEARFYSDCGECGWRIKRGDLAKYNRHDDVVHVVCPEAVPLRVGRRGLRAVLHRAVGGGDVRMRGEREVSETPKMVGNLWERRCRRFWERVHKTNECWEWVGTKDDDGYGNFKVPTIGSRAHRFAYTLLVGPIPPGLQIDHLCRNRACVNPAHLEPVTPAENLRRRELAHPRTHCSAGHQMTESNTGVRPDGRRRCKACDRDYAMKAYLKQKGLAL